MSCVYIYIDVHDNAQSTLYWHLILTLCMDVHPAELALEPLPGVPLHDLAADVAGRDVLKSVLRKLVVGLKDRRRLHLGTKRSTFKGQKVFKKDLRPLPPLPPQPCICFFIF